MVFGVDGIVIGLFVGWTVLAVWLVFLGGAEWLEDAWWGDLFLGVVFEIAPASPVLVVKLAIGVLWLLAVGAFLWSLVG